VIGGVVPTAERIDTLIGAYVEGPRLLERTLAHIPAEELRFTPGAEHWSIHDNMIHLADVELAYAIRIRYLLAEPAKIPLSFYGFQWSRALDYPSQSLDEALTLFRALRTGTAAFLRTLPRPAWEKVGMHWDQDGAGSELRTLTPAQAVEIFIDHVQYHLRTIAKRRAQYAHARGGA
jgi:uncharacterized damage-inducible protein DinB